jgi:hypothetical protein
MLKRLSPVNAGRITVKFREDKIKVLHRCQPFVHGARCSHIVTELPRKVYESLILSATCGGILFAIKASSFFSTRFFAGAGRGIVYSSPIY